MSKAQQIWDWLTDTTLDLFPFLTCALSGLVLAANVGWFGTLMAGLGFIFALELARSKARAKAEIETASKIMALMLSGHDTTISIDVVHREDGSK